MSTQSPRPGGLKDAVINTFCRKMPVPPIPATGLPRTLGPLNTAKVGIKQDLHLLMRFERINLALGLHYLTCPQCLHKGFQPSSQSGISPAVVYL